MKELVLLDKILWKIKGLSGGIFITIIILYLTTHSIKGLPSIGGQVEMMLFAILLITCIYVKMSNKIRYTLCYLSLMFFFHVMYFINTSFEIITSIGFYLPVIYGYLLQEVYSPIISGGITAINFMKFINNHNFNDEVIGKFIGLAYSTIGFTAIYYMVRKIAYQRDMYKQLSNIDTLTGVASLNYILQIGDEFIEKNTSGLAVYVLDINHFKQINDIFGHFVGNKVLVQIAKVLKDKVESYKGIVGRLGGDEFILLVPNVDEIKSKMLLKTLEEELKDRYFDIDNELTPAKITVSIGMEYTENQSMRIEELLHFADLNMYYNKQQSQGIVINKSYEDVLNEEYRELLDLLFEKDVYSFVHSQHVVQYAVGFAEYLGLSKEQIQDIILASWLHDIGKMLVLNEILRKRGKLTENEYSVIKSHVLWGITILSKYNHSENITEGVRYHHERWDGKGYPYGLKGQAIPLFARIIQIADSFSAMTIKRVYRGKLDIKEALKEIERCKGTQFDPVLAEKFIEFVRKEYVNN